jgi:hypothetical protein
MASGSPEAKRLTADGAGGVLDDAGGDAEPEAAGAEADAVGRLRAGPPSAAVFGGVPRPNAIIPPAPSAAPSTTPDNAATTTGTRDRGFRAANSASVSIPGRV